ncbi:MAG: hypothetical protein H0W85_06310 [Methylotenera sp.]|nr:hypothetical protein [Methylotenera sp.]
MLNFIISTIAFFVAIFILNRYLNNLDIENSRFRKIIVFVAATLISLGVGWAVDEIDGDAKLHENEPSFSEVVKEGDPSQIAKLLAGIH